MRLGEVNISLVRPDLKQADNTLTVSHLPLGWQLGRKVSVNFLPKSQDLHETFLYVKL